MGASFSPPLPPVASPARAELLGKFVPTSISRMPPVARMLRPLQVGFFGFFTAGILPLLQLRSRLGEYISLERQQLDLAAELAGCHLDSIAADEIARAASKIVTPKWIAYLSDLSMIGAIIAVIASLQINQWTAAAFKQFLFIRAGQLDQAALSWLVLISISYLFLYFRINRHVAQLQHFALAFNAANENRFSPIAIPKQVWGIRFGHLLVAGIMLFYSAVWGVPMMLAWAAYQTFVYKVDAQFRADLSNRLQQLSGVDPVVDRAGLCRNPGCEQMLTWDARFCPRCGHKTGEN